METKIYLVRHTQTIGNIEKRLTGRTDFEVTSVGEKYAYNLTKRLKDIKFDVAYASTSKRTSKTIQKLAELNNLPIIELEELCEMDFGIYDGMTWEEVNKIDPQIDKLHKETNEIMSIPKQETTEEVAQRMNKIMYKIASQNLDQTILICSHGVAIEAFLRTITKVPFIEQIEEYSQKNTAINILTFNIENKKFKIEVLNDLQHLNKEEI